MSRQCSNIYGIIIIKDKKENMKKNPKIVSLQI